jgi:hypothetical protein
MTRRRTVRSASPEAPPAAAADTPAPAPRHDGITPER